MIKPNPIFSKSYTVHGFSVPAAVGGVSCLLLFLGLIFIAKLHLSIAFAIALPFATVAAYLGNGKHYRSFVINLVVHPFYLYSQPRKIKRF